jgi:hypothetical protein
MEKFKAVKIKPTMPDKMWGYCQESYQKSPGLICLSIRMIKAIMQRDLK